MACALKLTDLKNFVVVPPGLANLVNLEILNLFNNHITELPISLSQMPKLRILNVGYVDFETHLNLFPSLMSANKSEEKFEIIIRRVCLI